MHGVLKRIGVELGRALLAALLVVALTGTGIVIASSVSGSSVPGTGTGALVGQVSPSLSGTVGISGPGANLTINNTDGTVNVPLTVSAGAGSVRAANFTASGNAHGIVVTGGGGASVAAGFFQSVASNGSGIISMANGTGAGVQAISTGGGPSLFLDGDETSPARSLITIAGATDADPTTVAVAGALNPVTSNSVPMWRVATTTTPSSHDLGSFFSSSTTNTAFAGGGQGSAIVVCDNEPITILSTVATGGDSAKLPLSSSGATAPPIGKQCEVWNRGAASANLFVGSGGTMVSAGAATSNGSIAIGTNRGARCTHLGSDVWGCSVLP